MARDRIRFIGIGAVTGIARAASLRGFVEQLAGPASSFTFGGTFGIIIGAGTATGALLGWAEYQLRLGRQYPSRARRIEASAGQDASPGSPSRPEADGLPGCG